VLLAILGRYRISPLSISAAPSTMHASWCGSSRAFEPAPAAPLSSSCQMHGSKINARLLLMGAGMTDFALNQTMGQGGPIQPASRPNLDKGSTL